MRVRRATVVGQLPEQVFPDAAPRPTREAIVDRRMRTIGFGTIAPATAALQHMDDAANHATIVLSFLASNFRRQMRFNAFPLLVAQRK